jgi:hypothetical protein
MGVLFIPHLWLARLITLKTPHPVASPDLDVNRSSDLYGQLSSLLLSNLEVGVLLPVNGINVQI